MEYFGFILYIIELVLGVIYPLSLTLRHLQETANTVNSKDNVWSTYWIVFAAMQSLAWFWPEVLSFSVLRCVILVFMVLFRGSERLYEFARVALYPRYLKYMASTAQREEKQD